MQPPNPPTDSPAEEIHGMSDAVAWPWFVKGGLALALAVIWVLILAHPALGNLR
jgi:hypothetical protein